MAVRGNLLEIHDYNTTVELYVEDLNNFAVFEKSEQLTKEELKRMSEHRRQINKIIKSLGEEIDMLYKEVSSVIKANFCLFIFIILVRTVMWICTNYTMSDFLLFWDQIWVQMMAKLQQLTSDFKVEGQH